MSEAVATSLDTLSLKSWRSVFRSGRLQADFVSAEPYFRLQA
jgi:hypothetical protein